MKTSIRLLLAVALGSSLPALTPALAQGTAFTYQGLLSTSNGPANGTYDLTFALWDSLAGGSQVGNSYTNPGWRVTDGLLTTTLDFGATFSGMPLWLEIGVRSNGVGAFSTLSPRQPLTPTPYAISAESATGLANGVALGSGVGNSISPMDSINSFIGGGSENNILNGSMNSVIAGGMANFIQPNAGWAFIGGGQNNQAFSVFSAIGGGNGNVITATGNYGTVGGGFGNTASGLYSTVGGGDGNVAGGNEATVGGGTANSANGHDSTVSGGSNNIASASGAFVGGGEQNRANGQQATVAGGSFSVASGTYSTVSGGALNQASGYAATVAGGHDNLASGMGSFACGVGNSVSGAFSFAAGANAAAGYDHCFIWSDNASPGNADYPNQFKINSASGVLVNVTSSTGVNPAALFVNSTSASGVGLYVVQTNSMDASVVVNSWGGDIFKGFGRGGATLDPNQVVFVVSLFGDVTARTFFATSDRNAKENFTRINLEEVLQKVLSLPISQWNFKGDSSEVQHLGPMAQDFHSAFGLAGADDKHVAFTDEVGVALAAIQGLNQKLDDKAGVIQRQAKEIEELKARLQALEQVLHH